jgi:zinc protease
MAVVVAGKVTFESALREVEKAFGGLRPQALPPRGRGEAVRPAAGKAVIVVAPGKQAYVMAAFVGPAAGERTEVATSDVLSVLLSYGCLGRLSGELVEVRKLATRVGVDFLTQREPALFGVWAVCETGNVAAVKEAIRGELQRLASEPIPPGELALAKRLVYAGYCFANETPADCASTLAFYQAVDSYRAGTQYPARVGAITAGDIARVAAWYAGEPVWVILMPEESAP